MHPYLLLLLLSSGVSSYFLPLQEKPRLLNETKHPLIDEMLCLLEAAKNAINETFLKPLHVRRANCAHDNTERFIQELGRIPTWNCMKRVEKGMERLENTCDILKKSPSKDEECLEVKRTGFSQFKESLKEFLRWVNGKLDCNNIGRSEWHLSLDGKCTCHDP